MALVQKRNSERTMILLGGLGLVIVVGLLIYFLVIAQPAAKPTANTNQVIQPDTTIIKNFGESVLVDPRYQALESSGDLPVNIGNIGRENPFIKP